MRSKGTLRRAAGTAAAVILAAGCGGGQRSPVPPDAGKGVKDGGELRVQLSEPRHLVPTNSIDTEGGAVIRSLYSGLVTYVGDNYQVENVMAESITSPDNRVWTIKIKNGWTFHNSEPVDADAYIRSWNAAAYEPNEQGGSYFFQSIEGYPDLQGSQPAAKEMSGLKKIDASSFQVTLRQAFVGFPVTLGSSAFMPMAKACAADLKACDEKPIGNGPYLMDGPWEHNQQIKLVRYHDFKGTRAHLDRLTFKIYSNLDTAYNDFLAGNIDLVRALPPAKVPEARAKFGGRLIEQSTPTFTYLGLPTYQEPFTNKQLRQALSLAIERQPIIDAVFQGRLTPARSFSPPGFPGGKESTCNYCDFNPARARQLLAGAGGWPPGRKLELWFNAAAGHEVWMAAVGDQIKRNLGIDYELRGQLQFAEYLETADAKKFTGPFRNAYLADYPFIDGLLKPLFSTGSSSNSSGYSSPEFDAKMVEGDRATSLGRAAELYEQAEKIIGEDLPLIPMWFGKMSVAFTGTVTNVTTNGIEGVDFVSLGFKK